MPKSKLKWKYIEGRVGPAWDGDEKELIKRKFVPKGFRFHSIEWFGKRFRISFVSE